MEEQTDEKQYFIPRLEDVKSKYQVPNFTTMNRPIFKKNGDIIEKPNKETELSIDGFIDITESVSLQIIRDESSEIIDSITLLRIQEDFKMLENRYESICNGFEFIVNSTVSNDKTKDKTIGEFTSLADTQNKRIEMLMNVIKLQADRHNEIVSQFEGKFIQKEKEISEKNEHIESLKNTISEKDNALETKDKALEAKDKTILEKEGAFTECFKLKAESEMREAKLLSELALERHENREFREKSQIGPGTMRSQSVPVESKKIPIEEGKLGHSWDPIIGLRDTLLNGIPFTLAREKQEQRIKNFYNEEYSALDNKEIGKLFAKDKTLVDCIGMPDTPSSLFYGQRDKTPLMLAAGRGNLQNVKFLVESNANVNYVDRTKSTALDYAYRFWDRDKIKNTSQVYHYLKDEKHALSGDDYVIEPAIKTPSK